jgi:hypothetical protein
MTILQCPMKRTTSRNPGCLRNTSRSTDSIMFLAKIAEKRWQWLSLGFKPWRICDPDPSSSRQQRHSYDIHLVSKTASQYWENWSVSIFRQPRCTSRRTWVLWRCYNSPLRFAAGLISNSSNAIRSMQLSWERLWDCEKKDDQSTLRNSYSWNQDQRPIFFTAESSFFYGEFIRTKSLEP